MVNSYRATRSLIGVFLCTVFSLFAPFWSPPAALQMLNAPLPYFASFHLSVSCFEVVFSGFLAKNRRLFWLRTKLKER